MPDVLRCPMCGKENPPDLEECQFCQARLTPLRIDAAEDQEPERPEQEGGDQPSEDWLGSLRQKEADEDSASSQEELPPDEEAEPAESVPDWLADMRSDSEASEPSFEEEDEEDASDWLMRLGGESGGDSEEDSEAEEISPADLPDWMQSLRAAEDLRVEEDLRAEETPEPGSMPEEEPAGPALPEDGGEGEPAIEMGELPDWLSSAAPEEEPEEPEAPAEGGEIPDWMAQFAPEEEEPEEPSEERLPDWLQEEDEGEPAIEMGELPDWLSSAAPEEEPEEPEEPEAPAEAGEVPEWMAQLAPDQAEEGPESPSEELLPDWLQAEPEEEPDAEMGDLPAWLESAATEAEEPEEAAAGAGGAGGEIPAASPEEELPDWLREEEGAGRPESLPDAGIPEELEASEGEPAPAGEDLSWLSELEEAREVGEPASRLEEEADREIEPGEVPEWFAGAGTAGAAAEAFSEGDLPEEEPEDLARADLPSWLQAMRPVDDADEGSPVEGEDQVEGAGPLAGLRGVLPSEPDATEIQKPPAYSVKLQVTETQQQNAEILSALVAGEGSVRPIRERQAISPQHLLRIAIALILVLMLLWPLTLGGIQAGLPQPPVSDSSFETYELVNALPPGAPVLVAFDYSPGFTGEMQAAASPVIDHLLFKNTYLALVSTMPTGPAQAERLLAAVDPTLATGQPRTYLPGDHYANLGFIPGGQAGLLGFALSPREIFPSGPAGGEGGFTWDAGPLAQVASVSDFSLVVVITESPETARVWVEQLEPLLGDTPLVMIASAQAAPVVRPYYSAASSQVRGLVSGLSGGAAYLTVRSNPALLFWNTFSTGALTAIVLILVGAVVNAISGAVRRSRESKGTRT